MLLQPKAHFVIVDQFAPVGLRDAFADGGAELVARFHTAKGGVLDEKLSVHPGVGGDAPVGARLDDA